MEKSQQYEQQVEQARNPETREQYWQEQAQGITWYKKPEKILDQQNAPFNKWYVDGILNTCYNCLDRHIEELGDQVALVYDSPITGNKATFTYNEVLENVSRLAGVLVDMGIQKGDRVIIYMPMIPQSVFAFLACARIGAIHNVVFGGFAPKELASRIIDSEPKLIITASCGFEPPKRIIDYKKNVDQAVKISGKKHIKILIFQRSDHVVLHLIKGKHYDFEEMLAKAKPVPCVEVEATHPLYILYTSGTTGTPKGICRDNGGNAVALLWTMKNVFNIHKGDVFFSGSDIGWVVGHSFIVYGPLLVGATTIIFEGKPVGTPDPGVYWRIIEEYNVKSFYTSPTALRAIRREDSNGEYFKQYNLSCLDNISIVGERSDIPTLEWLKCNLAEGVFINDTYWQTETGWPISCNYAYLQRFKVKFGSCVKPAPGYIVDILDDNHQIQGSNILGNVCIKLPLPPSCLITLYKHDQGFIQKYLKDHPGYYTTGDAGYFDEDGYLHIMARVDDVVNTAGHRLSTAQIEEVLNGHSAIVESAVVANIDDLKGEVPLGFVVMRQGLDSSDKTQILNELIQKVRDEIGPVACFKKCIFVPKLPKTRSGKILRHLLKEIADGNTFQIPPTIEDDTVIDNIVELVKDVGLGIKSNIQYEEDLKVQKKIKLNDDNHNNQL